MKSTAPLVIPYLTSGISQNIFDTLLTIHTHVSLKVVLLLNTFDEFDLYLDKLSERTKQHTCL